MSRTEEEIYNEIINSAPGNDVSAQTKNSASALAKAEAAAESAEYTPGEADKRLDKAINAVLQGRGFNYDTAKDGDYQAFKRQFKQFADEGRKQGIGNSSTLANGYEPTYADAAGNQIYTDRIGNIGSYAQTFRQLAQQEHSMNEAQELNAVNLLGQQAQREYGRVRDKYNDSKSFMNYLANRYASDKQSDSQLNEINASTYATRLAAAQDALNDSRASANNRYAYDTQSADSAARIEQSDRENAQKLEYYKAKDAYDERIAREKEEAAALAAEQAANAKAEAAAQTAREKAEAAEAQAAAKEQETAKYASWLLQKYLAGDESVKLSTKDRYNYDYNGDGQITNTDMVIAGKIAQGEGRAEDFKNISIVPTATDKTNEVIKRITKSQREVPNGNGKNRQAALNRIAQKWIDEADIGDEEKIYLYEYYNLA